MANLGFKIAKNNYSPYLRGVSFESSVFFHILIFPTIRLYFF